MGKIQDKTNETVYIMAYLEVLGHLAGAAYSSHLLTGRRVDIDGITHLADKFATATTLNLNDVETDILGLENKPGVY